MSRDRSALLAVIVACALVTALWVWLSPALAPPDLVDVRAPLPSVQPTPPSHYCEHATRGALLVADSDGYVCERFDLLARVHGGCCAPDRQRARHTCAHCAGTCCALYEHCVSCCVGTSRLFGACRADCAPHNGSAPLQHCFAAPAPTPKPSASASPSGEPGRAVEWLLL